MKRQSSKEMARKVIDKHIERWQQEIARTSPEHRFDTVSLKLRLGPLIEAFSCIPDKVVQAAILSGERLDVDGRLHLATDVDILKKYYAKEAADSLVEAHDKKQSHHIPADRMFNPSLFPKLDYEEARTKWLILGETQRVQVGQSIPIQWRMNDSIKDTNFKAQEIAHNADIENRAWREKLFRQNPDCLDTDALQRKLGNWSG